MANNNSSSFVTFILGIVFIISGWMVHKHFSEPMVKEAEASENWPTTSGIITYSDITQYTNNEGNIMYSNVINYEFTIDNKSYIGDRISLSSNGESTSSLGEVKKALLKYPVNATVLVYYDPELPNNAVLEPGANFLIYIVKYAPFIFGFFGVLMMWQLVKKMAILLIALLISTRK